MSVSIVSIFLLFCVLFILAGFVTLVVAAIKNKHSAGLWVAVAVVASLIFIFPLGLVYLNVQRVAIQDREASIRVQTEAQYERDALMAADALAAVEAATEPKPTQAEWRPASEIMPDAEVDFYPSQREAEQALAAAIVEAYGLDGREVPDATDPQPLTLIHHTDDNPPTEAYEPLADAIRELGAACREVQSSSSGWYPDYHIQLKLVPAGPSNPIGTYQARSQPWESEDRFAVTARFVDKPWLTDLSSFRIVEESPKLVMGFTPHPESTAEDAETAALRAVAAKLAPRVADQRGGSPSDFDSSIMYPELDSIVRNLRRLNLVEDQFTQRLERSYGSVFRHAVLVDANPQVLKLLYQGGNFTWVDIPPQQQLAQAPWPSGTPPNGQPAYAAADFSPPPSAPVRPIIFSYVLRVLVLGVLVGITLLIYRVLDNWTLGYRQGALSVTVIAVILGGALLLGLLWMA